MGIKRRGKKWWYRVWIRGREYSGSTGLDAEERNRKAALRFCRARRLELEQELRAGPKAEALPFPEAAGQFLAWARDVEYRGKPSTARRLVTSFASLAEFLGDRNVCDVTPGAVEDFKAWRAREHQVRDVTIRHDLHALSAFFRYARKQGWATVNPVEEVKIPSDKDSFHQHVVSEAEETAYFAQCKGTLHDVAKLILLTGCRPEEILSLRGEDIDREAATLSVRGGKTRAARRVIDLTGEALDILTRRLPAPGAWLFPSGRIEGGHVVKLNAQHDRACIDAGVSFRLYDLRHTFATRMAESGCDTPTLAAILGHSSLRVLMRYVHPTAPHRKEAVKRMERAMKPKLKVVGS